VRGSPGLSRSYVVGLDIGTSSIKALALPDGEMPPVSVRVATPTVRHPGGRAEHDPGELWDAVTGCIRALVGALPGGARVEAVAAATVGEALVPVGAKGEELRPVIAWHDQRGVAYVDRWEQDPGVRALYGITGQTADERATVNKILWILDTEPGVAADAELWLGMDAWVNLRLCGRAATSPSLAARTMLFDRTTLRWSGALVESVGLHVERFPPVLPGASVIGTLRRRAAESTGLPLGIPVVAGGHDHLCAAFAARSGTDALVDSIGSAESLVAVTDEPAVGDPDAHVNCYPDVEPGRYAVSAQVGATGMALDWVAREVYGMEPGPAAVAAMLSELGIPLRPTGAVFFPQFGRGTAPRWDPSAALGAFLGLTPAHRRRDLFQAVLEAGCFSLRQNLEWMAGHGIVVHEVRVGGGPSGSEAWGRLAADVLARPVVVVEDPELTARGAALLASVGAGWHADTARAGAAAAVATRTWSPSPAGARCYDELYRDVFSKLPDGLAPIHRILKQGWRSGSA